MGLDLGLLILRLTAGGIMLFAHGLPKMMNYSEYLTKFPDPIGVGAAMSLNLAIFGEVVCAALIVLGLFSRMATIPAMITMAVAFFIVHGPDPFQRKELALVFLLMYVVLFLTGPGRFSVQHFFKITSGRLAWLLK